MIAYTFVYIVNVINRPIEKSIRKGFCVKASKKLKSWRLIDCEMYVTLEPCTMCAGAIVNSRIKKVYIGTMDEKTGAVGSVFNLFEDYTFNHKVESETGILKFECENILKNFFKTLRKIKKGE